MHLHKNIALCGALFFIASNLTGCAKIDVTKGKGGQQQGGGQQQQQQEPQSSQPHVSGDWRLAFQFNNQTLNSTMHLEQNGNSFKGHGEDTEGGLKFQIEQGAIRENQVTFFKKYEKSPPVEYTGKWEVVNDGNYNGPMMSGEYTTANKGNIISSEWQADMDLPSNNPAPSQPAPDQQAQQQPEQPPPAKAPDHPPDLSGKWNCGYEFNFKTIHSTMFLEQDGSRITGHGTDSTKEAFTIEKGWYHYPKLTLVRKYLKTAAKGKKPEAGGRTMTFKADVSWVSDNDYQGPYLNGKTSGGGEWEAQQVQ